MDRRTILTITICFAIFMAWQKFYVEPRMPQQAPQTAGQQSAPSSAESTAKAPQKESTAVKAATPQARAAQTMAFATSTGNARISDTGKLLAGWDLKNYHLGLSADSPLMDLKSVTQQSEEVELAFDDPALAYAANAQGVLTRTPTGALWTYEDDNLKLTREIIASEAQPHLDVRYTAEFKTKKPNYAFLSIASRPPEGKDSEEQDRRLVYFTNNSLEKTLVKDVTALQDVPTGVKYVGATSRYFLITAVAQGGIEAKGLLQPLPAGGARASLVYPVAGNSITLPVRIYFGPKDLTILRSVDPTLDHTVDFGMWTIFAYPILKLMKWLFTIFQNYGVAIIIITLLLKLLTYPLTYKSMKSMKEMAKLQPQLQKVREKYKDDKEALNREMLTLMRTHGYNPMAGCLPILIQMPIFFALYQVLYSSIELYQAPFALWIKDLSAHDPFYVTPVLLSITMFVQQKLTPNTATDPMQAKMLQLMPLIFGAFMLALPSGLTLYMLVNAIASIIQQMILNKKLDTGHVSAVPARAR